MDLGKLVVSIEGDNTKLDNALKSSTTSVDKAMGQIVGAIGLGSIAFKGLELAAQGVKFNAMMESAEVGFGIMLGSVDEAKSKLAELKYLADHSPMTFSGVTAATTTLLQFGVAGDKVIPTVKMLGDVAGGNEERMKQLALAFAQVSAAGKLQGQDLLQMINAGYNPLLTISEKTGESMGELRDRMAAGAITSEEVAEAFKRVTSEGGQFFGMLEAKAKTLEGSFTTLDDATETFLGRATEAFTGPMLVGVQTLTGLLNVIPGELGTIALTVGTVTAGVGAFALGVGALAPAFAALGVTINIALLPLLGVTATVAAIGAAIAIVGKAWSDAQPKEERIKTLTKQFVDQGKTFREAQILARKLVDDQEKSAELTKTMSENYQGYYSAQARAAEEQKKADEAKIRSQDEINKQLKTWDDLNRAGIVADEQWLNEKIKIRQQIIDSLQEEVLRTGVLSEQAKADIKKQQDGIDNYNAELKVMKLRQSEVKVEVGKTVESYWELQDAQKVAKVKTVELTKETEKIPPYLSDITGLEYEIIDGLIVAKEKTADFVDEAEVLRLKYEEAAKAIQPMLTNLGYAVDLFGSLSGAAQKFGNEDLANILSGLAKMTNSAMNATSSIARLVASQGTDIGAWVQLTVSAVDFVGEAWNTFWGNKSKKEKEAEEKAREAEKERIAAIQALDEEYTKKTNNQLENLELERDKAIAEAKRIGANVFQIEAYYAGEIAKIRDGIVDTSAERARVAAIEAALKTEYDSKKKNTEAVIRMDEEAARAAVTRAKAELEEAKKSKIGQVIGEKTRALQAAKDALAATIAQNNVDIANAFADLDDQMRVELEKLVGELELYQSRAVEASSNIGTALTDALVNGTSEADFSKSIMDMLRKMAIDAAILAGGFADQFKAIGVMIAEALKDGLDTTELTSIKKATQDLYSSAKSYTSELDKMFADMGVISSEAQKALDDAAKANEEQAKEAQKALDEQKKLLEDRAKLEEEYRLKNATVYAQIEAEKKAALASAAALGASTLEVEKYYANKIADLQAEEAQKALEAQEKLQAEYKKTGDTLLSTMTNALGKGLSEADFTTSIMDTLRTMAIDAAVLAGGYADKFKAVGQTIAEALKDGFQAGEVESIKSTISSLYSSASSDIASINSLFNVPGFAGGTDFAPGGLALVGERGPELVNLPRGSSVLPAAQTQQAMAGSNKTIQINVQSNAPLDPLQTARAVRETMESLAFQGVA